MSAWLSMPVEDYCLTVDSMGTDAEGLAILALSKALSIRLRVVYLHRDRDLGHYSYPVDNEDPCHVHLLLSPGHYDLLYPALPTAWGGPGFVPRPADAGIAAAPAPWVAPRIGEPPASVCSPRSRALPLPACVNRGQIAPSSSPMHGIQVGSSVIQNCVSVPHSANNLFCALLYGMLLQEAPISAALRRLEDRCLGYSPSENFEELDSPVNLVGGTADACNFVTDLRVLEALSPAERESALRSTLHPMHLETFRASCRELADRTAWATMCKKGVPVCPSVFVALSAALGVGLSIVDQLPQESPHNFTVPTRYGMMEDAPVIALLRTGDHFDLLLLRALGDGDCVLSPLTISPIEFPRASSTCTMTTARGAQL